MRISRKMPTMAVALLLAGCNATVGSRIPTPFATSKANFENLPEESLRQAAIAIEREVYSGNREPELEKTYGLTLNTPEILQLLRARAIRVELVQRFLDSGHAWERRNGRLWVLVSGEYRDDTTSRQRDLDAVMVNSENRDRRALYEAIIEANEWPGNTRAAVELIFFEARQQFMNPGQKYELEDGAVGRIP